MNKHPQEPDDSELTSWLRDTGSKIVFNVGSTLMGELLTNMIDDTEIASEKGNQSAVDLNRRNVSTLLKEFGL